MRAGSVLTQFFALFATTAAAILSLAAAEREFELPRAGQRSVSSYASRCYRLALVGDSAERANVQLPKYVHLTSNPDEASSRYERGWFEVAVPAADTMTNRLGYYMHFPRWRPVGTDSLDIALPGWPIGIRMRIAARGDTVTGRLVQQGDSFEVLPFNGSWHILNWPRVRTVRAMRTSCAGEQAI